MKDSERKKQELAKYLKRALVDYQSKLGYSISMSEFAKLLGTPVGSMNQWTNAYRLPTGDNVVLIGDGITKLLGYEYADELYRILDLPRNIPGESAAELIRIYMTAPMEKKKEILDFARNIKGTKTWNTETTTEQTS